MSDYWQEQAGEEVLTEVSDLLVDYAMRVTAHRSPVAGSVVNRLAHLVVASTAFSGGPDGGPEKMFSILQDFRNVLHNHGFEADVTLLDFLIEEGRKQLG